ncbi:histidine-containing phosphotransfer protein [Salix suchowensis]|nr:histidine-containing phosphotransfer protein [Salix suchowensis]
MEAVQMQRTWVEYTKSLFREGFLDAQFQQLQLLQDESNPDFVAEVVSLFFEDSERLLTGLEHLNCLFIGAQRVKNDCIAFRSFCEEKNIEGYRIPFIFVFLFPNAMVCLSQLEQQIVSAGGSIPMEELSS